ncbi:MAG: hypothetical protein PVH88_00020 [Ignavibacteria bacterium]|jgi:hypothetical protein
MKTTKQIVFFLLLFLFVTDLHSQNIQEKEKSVDSLFTLVKKITPSQLTDAYSDKLSLTDEELEQAKELLYYSYAHAPIELEEKLHNWVQNWKEDVSQRQNASQVMKPNIRLQKLKECLEEKYGEEYVRFLETPYFMKVKVLEITTSTYNMNRPRRNIKVPKIDLKVEILDVVKGAEVYSESDKITISYLPHWFSETSLPVFEINNIYAFPLKHWSRPEFANYKELMLKLNGLHTLYKVDNNDMITTPLTPEKHIDMPWNDFRDDFKKKYLSEK